MLGWDQLCGQRNCECCDLLNGYEALESWSLGEHYTGAKTIMRLKSGGAFDVALAHDAYFFRVRLPSLVLTGFAFFLYICTVENTGLLRVIACKDEVLEC